MSGLEKVLHRSMSKVAYSHTPVLVQECLRALQVQRRSSKPPVFLDLTFGCGGHSRAILEANSRAKVWAIDRDEAAVERASALSLQDRLHVACRSFKDLLKVSRWPWPSHQQFDGILLDIGVSSTQIDDPARGFSYRQNGPLDMRMDQSQPVSAATWLNTVSLTTLTHALRTYGQERFAHEIAQQIIKRRPLSTTDDLVKAIFAAVGGNQPDEVRKHPARRTFQAIRIAINDELHQLHCALHMTQRLLKLNTGRLAVLTYHSLEEDIVQQFKQRTGGDDPALSRAEETLVPSGEQKSGWDTLLADMTPPSKPTFVFDALVMNAAGKEQRLNPRARSARLFAATRTDAPPIDFMSQD